MNPAENPRTAAELCDWLEAHRLDVGEAIRRAPADDRRSARATWSRVLDRLEADPGGDAFDDGFGTFLDTLLDLPGVERLLPEGFNGYLLPGGRQPTRRAADEICRKFRSVIRILNEDVQADEAEAIAPTAPSAEPPRTGGEPATARETRP